MKGGKIETNGGAFAPPIPQRPQPLGYFRCDLGIFYIFPSLPDKT
jgi:hypothetical protein